MIAPPRHRIVLIVAALLAAAWAAAYFLWPRFSFDDGPFVPEPFAGDVAGLSLLSSVDLTLFGATLFILETRATRDPDPGTVFLLKNSKGNAQWARMAPATFGRIRLAGRAPRWFAPGGWVIAIKPERTESGVLYLSPFGEFRFFFHSW